MPLFSRVLGLLLLVGLFSFVSPDEHGRPKHSDLNRAGALFIESCISCHLPPDPNYATDRAWLNQIKDTA